MTDNPEALGLEQRCSTPGHWVIEGRHVYRHGGRWQIYAIGDHPMGRVPPVKYTDSLAAARDWIRDRRSA